MDLPREVPVMVLPNATLFPQAMLPLHIFEPRYRRMLTDALESRRMLALAMQRPSSTRASPCRVAGLGLIRACVTRQDGTSNLILQGLARVELGEAARCQPYRIHRIHPLWPRAIDSVRADALVAKVRELVGDRCKRGLKEPSSPAKKLSPPGQGPDIEPLVTFSFGEVLKRLAGLEDAEQLADLVACTLLSVREERQVILETLDLEQRLKHLVRFLMAETQRQKHLPDL